jgi:hypothetical protein
LREDKPVINANSTTEQKERLAKWEKADRLSLIAIKRTVFEHLLGGFLKNALLRNFSLLLKRGIKYLLK